MYKAHQYQLLWDKHRLYVGYYRSKLSLGISFQTLSDWGWKNGCTPNKIKTYDDGLSVVVL